MPASQSPSQASSSKDLSRSAHHRAAELPAGAVLITGGGRGIGAACARRIAAAGYDVCVNYAHDATAANALVAELTQLKGPTGHGVRAIAVRADVSKEEDVLEMYRRCDAELGPLHALVNNAGVVAPATRVDAVDVERLHRLFGINVVGAFLCAREAVRRLSTRHGGQGGVIVNISSVAARLGSPNEYVDYAASKGAVDTLTKGLALEVAGESVRVVGIRPGLIDTDIHASGGEPGRAQRIAPSIPVGRAGTADEIAAAVLWLVSDDASYTTGAILDVSGGR